MGLTALLKLTRELPLPKSHNHLTAFVAGAVMYTESCKHPAWVYVKLEAGFSFTFTGMETICSVLPQPSGVVDVVYILIVSLTALVFDAVNENDLLGL